MNKLENFKFKILLNFILCSIVSIFMIFFMRYLGVPFENIFKSYDAEHYINIAINGYQKDFEYAFFPLTSIIFNFFYIFGFDVACILFFIFNQILKWFSLIFIYEISKKQKYDENILFFICNVFIWSPLMFFYTIPYSEAIMIFLISASFYLLLVIDNKKWYHYILLGCAIGLNVFSKATGALFFFSIFIYMFIQLINKKEKFKNIFMTYVIATPLSLLYPIYLFVIGKSPFFFITVENTEWGHQKSNIILNFIYDILFIKNETNIDLIPTHIFTFFMTWFFTIFSFYLIIKNILKRKNIFLCIVLLIYILFINSTYRINFCLGTVSTYRYILRCPIFFVLMDISNKKAQNILLHGFIILGILLFIFNTFGIFIA